MGYSVKDSNGLLTQNSVKEYVIIGRPGNINQDHTKYMFNKMN
jgi:hypothetical protein